MHHVSALVLAALIAWTLILLVWMELARCVWISSGRVKATALLPDNANLSPFMHRLARAHANCVEGLPVFGGLLLVALVTGHADITDGLATWLLVTRLAQSGFHLASGHVVAMNLRFLSFVVQLVIAVTLGGGGRLIPERLGIYRVTTAWRREGGDWRCYSARWTRHL